MNAKVERDLRNSRPERLSEVKAQYAALLERDPDNAEAKEAIALINQLLKEFAVEADEKIKVEALVTTPIDGKILEKGSQAEVTKRQYHALAARLKKVAVVAGVLALLLAVVLPTRLQSQNAPNQATQYTASALVQTNGIGLDGTNVNAILTGSAITNYYQMVSATKYGDVGVFLQFKLMTAGSGAVTALLDGSADGVNWMTNYATLAVTANGTTTVNGYTNITMNSLGYLRFNALTNANTGTAIATNILVRIVYKPSRFGT